MKLMKANINEIQANMGGTNILDPINGKQDRCYLGIFPNNASLDLDY